MKSVAMIVMSCLTGLLTSVAIAKQIIPVELHDKQAQAVYENLVGPGVENDAAMSHAYRIGKNIRCTRVNADMDDKNGKPIPANDVRRYSCTMQVDENGVVALTQP